MIKNLLIASSMALVASTASADVLNLPLGDDSSLGSGWGSTYSAATHTITYDSDWTGRGWWFDDTDWSAYDEVVLEIEPVEFMVQLVVEYVGGDNGAVQCPAGDATVTLPLNPDCKANVRQLYLQSSKAGAVTLVSAQVKTAGPEIKYDQTELKLDGANLPLAEFVDLPDDTLIRIAVSISNADSQVGPGWGVGNMIPSNQWGFDGGYAFIAKEVSKEGAVNNYDLTAGKLKFVARGDKEEGDYIVDEYGLSGVTFNFYNGATLVGVYALTPESSAVKTVGAVADGAVEYYNLQGVRVANPTKGLYIKRQGGKAVKVTVR